MRSSRWASTCGRGSVREHVPHAGPADCEVSMVSLMRRNPALSPDEFVDHWREVHAPLALRRHAGLADYHQYVVAETLTAETPEIDGIAQLGFVTRCGLRRSPLRLRRRARRDPGRRRPVHGPSRARDHARRPTRAPASRPIDCADRRQGSARVATSGSILGNAVLRREDPGILVGDASTSTTSPSTALAHVVFVRSTIAHARLDGGRHERGRGDARRGRRVHARRTSTLATRPGLRHAAAGVQPAAARRRSACASSATSSPRSSPRPGRRPSTRPRR